MTKKLKIFLGCFVGLIGVGAAVYYFHHTTVAVLEPRGPVAAQERRLIFYALLLSLVVVIPVFVMLFGFAWKYRESNISAKYRPNWDHSRLAESIWWIVPSLLITVLSVITWRSSHQLDPYKPLSSAVTPITVQVVALDWKWLFIYPNAHIASVNDLRFPVNTPVNFVLTADAPMNSFWIPQLGGQIYAMPGMSTQLHLSASQIGSYYGESANISGQGFAGMHFLARATTRQDYQTWVNQVRTSTSKLTTSAYAKLALPSENNQVSYYADPNLDLYDSVIQKYMSPTNATGMSSAMDMQ
jgi:cytochrome o ubiquinol oxidase subunit 2